MEKKQPVAIRLDRNPYIPFQRTIFATQFNLRIDSIDLGLIEVVFSFGFGAQANFSVTFDDLFVRDNHQMFVKYLAGLSVDPDDRSMNPKLPPVAENFYANIFQLSYSGIRAETWFGHGLIHDTANARREGKRDEDNIVYVEPVLAVYSSLGLQKKLISEIFRLLRVK
jgi:hypothetical protein